MNEASLAIRKELMQVIQQPDNTEPFSHQVYRGLSKVCQFRLIPIQSGGCLPRHGWFPNCGSPLRPFFPMYLSKTPYERKMGAFGNPIFRQTWPSFYCWSIAPRAGQYIWRHQRGSAACLQSSPAQLRKLPWECEQEFPYARIQICAFHPEV